METSLTIKAVAIALGRSESRIRQRLLQCSLYGFRRGRSWLLAGRNPKPVADLAREL